MRFYMKEINDYRNRIYGGILGKVIGVIHGANTEGWEYERIKSVFGEIKEYPFRFKNFCSDDDINGPIFYMRAMNDFPCDKVGVDEMAHTLMNYVAEGHGFFWWGGYGVSTEHTVYENLMNGIPAPMSGSKEQNGKTIAEQIGGQIFSDCWGFLCPGDIEKAADLSAKMASITHDGDGLEGAKFVAACIAKAFVAKNVDEILDAGVSVLNQGSHYKNMVVDVRRFCKYHPESWEEGFYYVKEKYGYQHYEGVCHIIPNAAVIVLSLVYGNGDYSKTINIGNMCGWDTDCNVGNLGAILGIFVGAEAIEEKWLSQVNDFICASSVVGYLNIQTVSQVADLAARITHSMYNVEPDDIYKKIFSYKEGNYIHFEYPHATGAFRGRSKSGKNVLVVNENGQAHFGNRCLKIAVPSLENGEEFMVYRKTYYQPKDFNDSRYDPDFSPVMYPGDAVKVWVKGDEPTESLIEVVPFIRNRIGNAIIELSEQSMELEMGEWKKIQFTIPCLENLIVEEVGLTFKCQEVGIRETGYSVIAHIDEWEVIPRPNYKLDFKYLPVEKWNAIHQMPAHFTYLRGIAKIQDEQLYISGSGKPAECYTGNINWNNYEFTTLLNPAKGNSHEVLFRVQGAMRNYSISLENNNQILLRKRYGKESVLIEKPFEWKNKECYTIKVTCIKDMITVYLNEREIIQYQDKEEPLLEGCVGFGNRQASRTGFYFYEINSIE